MSTIEATPDKPEHSNEEPAAAYAAWAGEVATQAKPDAEAESVTAMVPPGATQNADPA